MSRWLFAVFFIAIAAAPAIAQEAKSELRWGTDPSGNPPYVYRDPSDPTGNFTGFEVDLAEYLASRIGRAAVMRKGDWSKLPELLDKSRDSEEGIDVVLNGYELREDLARKYRATIPYYAYRLMLMTQRENQALGNWSDLASGEPRKKTVGVLSGTVAQQELTITYGSRIELALSDDVANVIGKVVDRQFDGTVQDNPAAVYFLKENPTLKAAGPPQQLGYYVMYLRKDDTQLAESLNKAVKAGMEDGSIRKIYQKYGLWNDDQKWLSYAITGNYPSVDEAVQETVPGTVHESPWPWMIKELFQAAGMTVFLSITSFPMAMLIGLLVALGRVYGPRWAGIPLGFYVEVLRGTPLLLQLYTIFYLLPKLGLGIDFSPVQAGIIGLAINYSAYEAENYRAGLLAIPRGQMEAALALGMTPLQAIRIVIVPQAIRIVIPPVTNDFIALFKDTSVCSVILITELTRKYNELYNFNRDYVVGLAVVTASLYLIMSYPMAILARVLEHRLSLQAGGAGR